MTIVRTGMPATGRLVFKVFSIFLGRKERPEKLSDDSNEEEELEINGKPAKAVDIPEDAYGTAILACVKDLPALREYESKEELEYAIWNFLFSALVLFVNLFLQSSILGYVFRYVVSTEVAITQRIYADFRQNLFDSHGTFLEDNWGHYESRSDLCQIAMWNRGFYYAVLICWALVMLVEFNKSESLLRQMISLPTCTDARDMINAKGNRLYVVALTSETRVCLVSTVALPKIAISMVLFFLGCEWLSATIQFESLVMNTVALAFIVNIDEILYEAVLPKMRRDEVERIDFLVEDDGDDASGTDYANARMGYRKASWSIIIVLIGVYTYACYIQDVLPLEIYELAGLCEDYLNTRRPNCNGWTWYLRGNPSAKGCFPFPAREPPPKKLPMPGFI